ncbi:hypothetical protein Leryth_006463 [Lithospermum erythrorhizon]|nr:hypothetical protein Leryth_006463 [Lithospermum erythrorhizon]
MNHKFLKNVFGIICNITYLVNPASHIRMSFYKGICSFEELHHLLEFIFDALKLTSKPSQQLWDWKLTKARHNQVARNCNNSQGSAGAIMVPWRFIPMGALHGP